VAAIYVFRFYLQSKNSTLPYSSLIASVLNTVQITIFNMIYQWVAVKLTNWENHRTDTLYEDSLIVKTFVFQFVNSYASFFFISFIAGNLDPPNDDASGDDNLGQCGYSDCMEPLSINLAIIFGSRLTISNFMDIFIPYYNWKSKFKKETEGVDPDKLTPAEKDYILLNYDPMIESIKNYADTAVQYGFTLLFITALPCASFFSLVNNYVKTKFNMWKLITVSLPCISHFGT
jgi:anoctamin-10/anoctamin-7